MSKGPEAKDARGTTATRRGWMTLGMSSWGGRGEAAGSGAERSRGEVVIVPVHRVPCFSRTDKDCPSAPSDAADAQFGTHLGPRSCTTMHDHARPWVCLLHLHPRAMNDYEKHGLQESGWSEGKDACASVSKVPCESVTRPRDERLAAESEAVRVECGRQHLATTGDLEKPQR